MTVFDSLVASPETLTLTLVINAVFGGLNLLLNTYLVNRRVKKDRLDDQRWSICPLVSDGPSVVHHKHDPTKRTAQ